MTIESLDFTQIRMDGGTQSRADIDEATVREYQEAMAAGAEFPPPIVFHDGSTYWLADGFHRVFAWRRVSLAGRVQCDIRQGTQRDAVLYSVGANTRHGLRRNPADKRRAVLRLLHDPEWGQWSSRAIADKCGVSHTFVDDLRKKAADAGNGDPTGNVASGERVYERNGKRQTMETGNIGGNGREPNYVPISRLESIVRGWLPFRTGGTDRATWLRVLAGLQAGRGDDWHTALLPYVATRAPEFRGDDLAQACRNLYQQIGGEVVAEAVPAASPQRAELPALAVRVTAWLRDYVDDQNRTWQHFPRAVDIEGHWWFAFQREFPGAAIDVLRNACCELLETAPMPEAVLAELPPLPTAPAAIEVPAETAETPMYGGIAAVWGPLLGEGARLPPDQVGPALRWLFGELEFLSARAGHDGVEMSLASAALAVKRAIGKGMF